MHCDIERVVFVGAKPFTKISGFARLSHCRKQTTIHVHDFTTQINKTVVPANSQHTDNHALNEQMRICHQMRDIFTRTRLGFVGIDHEVARATISWGKETPL